MSHIALDFVAKGSEYIVGRDRGRVLKLPRLLSWRLLMGRWRQRVEEDIALLNAHDIAHGDSRVQEGGTYRIGGRVIACAFAVRQQYITNLNIIRESHLQDATRRRRVLQLLHKSLQMKEEGRAIDLTGMEAVSHFFRALLRGEELDLGMHNLHWDGSKIVLLDIGLLPIAGWHPVALINRRIAHLQHELVWAVLQPYLADRELSDHRYQKVLQLLREQRSSLIGRLIHKLSQSLYEISRTCLP